MKESKKTIPIFISHQGCPNDCVFCNQRKITKVAKELSRSEMIQQIDDALKTVKKPRPWIEIAFFGGSFTAIEEMQQERLLQMADQYYREGKIDAIRLSTRPDAINQKILDRLKQYPVEVIELGVQSMDESVLQASNRGHDAACVYDSSELILKNGFKLGLQMMLGLPLDNWSTMKNTVEQFVRIKPHFTRIYPVLVIKETELESLFKNKLYEPLALDEAVSMAKYAFTEFRKNGIEVIRIGLQASDTIAMGVDVVAGPYHPAFGELVYAQIFKETIENYIQKNHLQNMRLPIAVEPKNFSKLIGNRKSNRIYFEERYGITLELSARQTEGIEINGEEIQESTVRLL